MQRGFLMVGRFFGGPPPLVAGDIVERTKTKLADDFVPSSTHVLILDPQIIRVARQHRSRGGFGSWLQAITGFSLWVGDHLLWVRACAGLWTIERQELSGREEALSHRLSDSPALATNCADARGLAELCYPNPPKELVWFHWIDVA